MKYVQVESTDYPGLERHATKIETCGMDLSKYAPAIAVHRALERAACEERTGVVFENDKTTAIRFESGREIILAKRGN